MSPSPSFSWDGKEVHLSVMACHSSSSVHSDLVADDSVAEVAGPDVDPVGSDPPDETPPFSAKARATILYRLESWSDSTMLKMVRRLASRSLRPVAVRKNSFPDIAEASAHDVSNGKNTSKLSE